MAIQFYTNPMSRGQIARWALHEAGADHEAHIIGYDGSMKADAYLAINPMGKVPAIVDDGHVITECAAICAYLAERFPDKGLTPRDDAERAAYYRWMFFAAGPVEQAVTAKSQGWTSAAESEAMIGFGNYDRTVSVLSGWFADHDFVCGDRFTMADVYVGSQVQWGLEFGSITTTEPLKAYAERLKQRPAWIAAKAIDMGLIAEMQGAK